MMENMMKEDMMMKENEDGEYDVGEEEYKEAEKYKKIFGRNNNEGEIILGKKNKRDIIEDEGDDNDENEHNEENEVDEYDDDDDEDEENNEGEEEEDEENEEDSYEFNCETGEIGEEIVYKDIKEIKHKGKIEWTNKDGESFKPYDFVIKKGNKTIYIDAKSTVCEKGNDPLPIISENEQEFINTKNSKKRLKIKKSGNQ